jgi:hypothetical protein
VGAFTDPLAAKTPNAAPRSSSHHSASRPQPTVCHQGRCLSAPDWREIRDDRQQNLRTAGRFNYFTRADCERSPSPWRRAASTQGPYNAAPAPTIASVSASSAAATAASAPRWPACASRQGRNLEVVALRPVSSREGGRRGEGEGVVRHHRDAVPERGRIARAQRGGRGVHLHRTTGTPRTSRRPPRRASTSTSKSRWPSTSPS